jgi:hypothetical protein
MVALVSVSCGCGDADFGGIIRVAHRVRAPDGDVYEVAATTPRPLDDKVENGFSDLSVLALLVEVGDPAFDVSECAFTSALLRKNKLKRIVCA